MNDTSPSPRPAATVILLRRSGRHRQRELELLMVRRGPGQSFMPGVWVFPGGAVDPGETEAECAVRELAEETRIELGPEAELHPWARWITPAVVPVRFDTYFFVALAPPHTPPQVDGAEVDEARWVGPRAALDEHTAGELKLVFPTVKTLETLTEFERAEDVMAAAPEREVEPILPKVAGTREEYRIILPWEEGYESAAG